MSYSVQDLVTINLKYGTSVKPLKTLAFAQIIANVLFQSSQPINLKAIIENIPEIIGTKKISKELVSSGIEYLLEIKKIQNIGDRWQLTEVTRKEFEGDIGSARHYLNKTLQKHFSIPVSSDTLKSWFKEAAASFFCYYGDEWVAAVSKGQKKLHRHHSLETLLAPSIHKYQLNLFTAQLNDGFIKFISSNENTDQQYLMLLSQAWFSARLVASDLGVDPITLEEFQDAVLVVDTNIIFAIVLENHRLAASIEALEEALRLLRIKLLYVYETKDEYRRAVAYKKNLTLGIAGQYPSEIIEEVNDAIIATAKSRGCRTKEDYERFFDTLTNIPQALPSGLPLQFEDYKDMAPARETAEKDITLKHELQKLAIKMRGSRGPKSDLSIGHDAVLFHTARLLKTRGQKSWVLTLDRSLAVHAINKTLPQEIPEVLTVSALIEMLAVNNAGPGLNASKFAPLLSNIILHECMPPEDTYFLEDLVMLHKMNEKAGELPVEDIKGMLKEVVRYRVKSSTTDHVEGGTEKISTDLALKINRKFQESSLSLTGRLVEANERNKDKDSIIQEKERIITKREKQFITLKVKELHRKAIGQLIISLLWRVAFSLVFPLFFFFLF
jgi:hypothetical protein